MVPRTEAASFTFTMIDSCISNICHFGARPGINDSGTVAYWKDVNPVNSTDSGSSWIIAGNGVTSTTIDTSNSIGHGNPSINNLGQVAYPVVVPTNNGPETGIRVGNGFTDMAVTPLILGRTLGDGLDINNSGVVAYYSYIAENGPIVQTDANLYATDGTTTTTIASSSGNNPYNFYQGVSINTSGLVAFDGDVSSGGSSVFTGNGGPVNTIAHSVSGNYTSTAAINDSGVVAWAGPYGTVPYGVFTSDGTSLNTVAANNTGDFSQFGPVSINNAGDVAFAAQIDPFAGSGTGLFYHVGPGLATLADNVIRTNDTLFGQTVLGLDFWNNGLNNSGSMVFVAGFDNGWAVVRADVSSSEDTSLVPEPFTLLLFGSGLALLHAKRRARRD